MMRRWTFISLLLLLLLPVGCKDRIVPDRETVGLNIYVRIPEATGTKAAVGKVDAELAYESTIHDLKIWIFLSEDVPGSATYVSGYRVGYLAPRQYTFQNGQLNHFTVQIEKALAQAGMKVDVYVLANAVSIGMGTLDENTTRDQLDALFMDGELFGVKYQNIGTEQVPNWKYVPSWTDATLSDTGLPFTAVGKSFTLTGNYPMFSIDAVQLKRAVSKFRFVFSQFDGVYSAPAGFTVTDLKLTGNKVAAKEFLFNTTNDPWRIEGYEAHDINFVPPVCTEINSCADPAQYVFNGGLAQDYQDLILGGIANDDLTSVGLCYLRESDLALTGSITYTLTDATGITTPERTANFTMAEAGGFARSRYWIVYVYFTADGIQFSVSWTDWENGHDYPLT